MNCYLLCGTPRTGSTLLCQYLTSTGIAGRPHSYFRKEDMVSRAKNWQILHEDGSYNFADYLIATRAAASTENGVIAIRIMWGTLEEMTADIAQLYPQLADDDIKLLEKAFGKLKFVYLYRQDIIAQAISLYRAEKTDYWHSTESQPPQQPVYDFKEIKSNVDMLDQHHLAWKNWFQKVGVDPLSISYEELSADPISVTKGLLRFLELDLSTSVRLEASNQRLADATSLMWIERFTVELDRRII